ncbi:MAG TPA: Mpo1-like protein [Bradyrhizobium sp.]|nr:Mpo1-like protein [Bradyrhizobium sp.]
MTAYLQRQLTDYVEYHRDSRNCAMHVLGILLLFLGATLPLSMWTISLFGVQTTMATLLALPVLIYWLVLDFTVGLAIAGVAVLLLSTATMVVDHASVTGVWITTAVLIVTGVTSQIVGHQVFEQRQPALVDNPSHLLLGPIFVMAKLFIAFGFRRDLAAIIGPTASVAGRGGSLYADDR